MFVPSIGVVVWGKLMEEKGKPEAEQARYRKMRDTLAAKVLVLEAAAQTNEVQAQSK